MSSIRDWHQHGIDLKVELATAGTLILGGLQTNEPFVAGGANGAPTGFTLGVYNQTPDFSPINSTTDTSLNRWSVSMKSPLSWNQNNFTYFIWKQYNVVQGKRYQLGIRYRTMEGKDKANVMVRVEYQNTSSQWIQWVSHGVTTTDSQADWTEVLLTTQPIPAGPSGQSKIRCMIGGAASWTVSASAPQNWGIQFDNLYWVDVDVATVPLEWKDISCDVQALTIRYGREKFTNRYDVASLSVELNNEDGEYTYREFHPFGLRPGRQVRVTATYKTISYPMAFHIIDSMVDSYELDGTVKATWTCVDPTTLLSDQTVKSGRSINMNAYARFDELMRQVGYRNYTSDIGVLSMQPILFSGRSIRDEAGLMGDSEGGSFFADRQGFLVYKDRGWITTDPNLINVTADILACEERWFVDEIDGVPTLPTAPLVCAADLDTDWSLSRVINIVSLANAGGGAQVFIDQDSVENHGPHTYQRHDFILANDYDLPTRANDLMTGYADPRLRVNTASFAAGISARHDARVWPFVLSVFLNWLVRVWYVHPKNSWGYTVATHIQSVAHRITATDWSTVVALDQPIKYTDIDFSDVGWDIGKWDLALWDEASGDEASYWDSGELWDDPMTTWGT